MNVDYSILHETTQKCVKDASNFAKEKNFKSITLAIMLLAIMERYPDNSRTVLEEMNKSFDSVKITQKILINLMPTFRTNGVYPQISEELNLIFIEAADRGPGGELLRNSVTPMAVLREIVLREEHARNTLTFIRSMSPESSSHSEERSTNGESSGSSDDNVVEQYCVDLTKMAAQGKLDPVIGRDVEMGRVIRVLMRKTKRNPVLVGDEGTGKTSIVEGLAIRIARGNVPEGLKSSRILMLSIASFMTGTGRMGAMEEKVKTLVEYLTAHSEVILFIDEIHLLMGAGRTGGPMDLANLLKPALARGEIRLIGATTVREYTRYIEEDKAFERRLQRVNVEELSPEDTKAVLRGIRPSLEEHHGLRIDDAAIESSVELSERYLTNSHQPDKSIDLLDEASSEVCTRGGSATVGEEDVRKILSEKTGIPVCKMKGADALALMHLEERLASRVKGQDEALNIVSRHIRRNRVNLSDASRPIGVFLFVGPTGVGKTETAKTLSEELMGSADAMVRIDMSEYQQDFSTSRLIGSPPGYIGFEKGGQLTEAVRRRPYSVILLDEIEKAHNDVFNLLLQLFDDGRLTDGQGRTVDFKNTIIIMTSNLGSREMSTVRPRIGYASDQTTPSASAVAGAAVKECFPPEFLNRLDAVVYFNPLSVSLIHQIAENMLGELRSALQSKGYDVEFDQSVVEAVMTKDADLQYGARPIRRAVESEVTDSITDMILSGELVTGSHATIIYENGSLKLNRRNG